MENFQLHQTGSIYVLLILFGVCFSKQKILSTYVWKVSRCLEKSVEVLAFNSFVSVSLVLLMEGFLEGTQRFNFDFNYQSTSSVEKHNTVWQCERLKVLTLYLTPVTLLYIVWRVQSAFLHHLNLSNTTTEFSYLFVLLYDISWDSWSWKVSDICIVMHASIPFSNLPDLCKFLFFILKQWPWRDLQ